MGEYNKRVGINIRTFRTNNNLTLKEVASRIGIEIGTLQKYETGKIKRVSVEMLNRIANALEVDPRQLTGWQSEEDEKKAHDKRIAERESKWINKYHNLSFENQKKINDYILMVERKQDYSPIEKDIITMFRVVNEDTQNAVLDTLKSAYKRCIEREKTKAQ